MSRSTLVSLMLRPAAGELLVGRNWSTVSLPKGLGRAGLEVSSLLDF